MVRSARAGRSGLTWLYGLGLWAAALLGLAPAEAAQQQSSGTTTVQGS